MVSEIEIAKVKVGERCRKDLGDLKSMMDSIEVVGLLHPIVIDSGNRLIVGARRLAAYKQLGRKTIPATVAKDISDACRLIAEQNENTCRKDMLVSEATELAIRIEDLERPKAAKRKAEGQKRGARVYRANRPIGSGQKESDRSATIAAGAAGMGRHTFQHAKTVVAEAKKHPKHRDLVEKMDRTGKVEASYNELQVRLGKRKAPTKYRAPSGVPKSVRLDSPVAERIRTSARSLKKLLAMPGDQISYVVARERFDELWAAIVVAFGK